MCCKELHSTCSNYPFNHVGLPPCEFLVSDDAASVHNKLLGAQFKECPFPISDGRMPSVANRTSAFQAMRQQVAVDVLKASVTFANEAHIASFILSYITDICNAYGVDMDVMPEVAVVSLRPDIWLVLINRLPVGVIEVKKPGGDPLSNAKVHRQILNYLLQIRCFHGLRYVFGILTTYSKWRVVWLPDCDRAAAAGRTESTESTEFGFTLPDELSDDVNI